MLERQKELENESNILLYKDENPIRFNYAPLVWEKDSEGALRTHENLKGHVINKSFVKRFIKNYPQAKVKKIRRSYFIILDDESLLEYDFKRYQSISHGIETLNMNVKKILDENDIYSFKIMVNMFSLEDKLNHRTDSSKLTSIKIPCSFRMSKEKTICLNLSILEYAIHVTAENIIEYLKETNTIISFPLKHASFVSVHTYHFVHQLREDVIPDWNQITCNYTPLEVAIELKKNDITYFLLEKINYLIHYKNYTTAASRRIVQSLIDWLRLKIDSNDEMKLSDDLLSKRKMEVDTLLKKCLKNDNADISLSLLFNFYIVLAEYWHKKSRISVSFVPTDSILSALSQAKFIFETIDDAELIKINPLDVHKIGTIKSQLYQDAANNQGLHIEVNDEDTVNDSLFINRKIIDIQIKFNIAALALDPNNESLRNLTRRYVTEYYNLAQDNITIRNDERNFLNYRSKQLNKFLNTISLAFDKHQSIPSIDKFLNRHIYHDAVFDVIDDTHKRTIRHWMAVTNQLEKYHFILPCSENFIYDQKGYTPIGLLAIEYGLAVAIELLKKNISSIGKEEMLIDETGDTILHQACKMSESNFDEVIYDTLSLFNITQFDMNCTNSSGDTPFDILMQSILLYQDSDATQPIDKISTLITTFINRGAHLSDTLHLFLSDLLDKAIQCNWTDLTQYLINNQWPIEISKTSYVHLLNNKMYCLIVDILQIYSQQKSGKTSDLCLIHLEQDIVRTLLTHAQLTNQQGAFAHIVAYFEASLDMLDEQQNAIQNLLSFYYSLETNELKNDFSTKIIKSQFKRALHADIAKQSHNHKKIDNHEQTLFPSVISSYYNDEDNIFCYKEEHFRVNEISQIESFYYSLPNQTDNEINTGIKRKYDEISKDALISNVARVADSDLIESSFQSTNTVQNEIVMQSWLNSQSVYDNDFLTPMLLFNTKNSPTRIKDQRDDDISVMTQQFKI